MTVQTLSSRCFLLTFNAMKASNKFVVVRDKNVKKMDIIASTGGDSVDRRSRNNSIVPTLLL